MDWLAKATQIASDRHDSTCRNRSGCSSREWHIQDDYMYAALEGMVLARKQDIEAAEKDIRAMRMWRRGVSVADTTRKAIA